MRVLLLSPYPERLSAAVIVAGDTWSSSIEPLGDENPDWIVSFGYRHIVRQPHLSRFAERIINIHISALPWNRGADPNLWSWVDGTPKGVSIHRIDAGIDTGELLAQTLIEFGAGETLRSSYDALMRAAAELFAANWERLRVGACGPVQRVGVGSYHNARDKAAIWAALPLGHDTPVDQIRR